MDRDLKNFFSRFHTTLSEQDKRSIAFLLTMTKEDDVAAIIWATAHIQDLLFQLFSRNLERPDLAKPSTYSFSRLVQLCRLVGEIPDELAQSLKMLAEIRNPLAHDLMHEINPEAVTAFYDSLPKRSKDDFGELLLRSAFSPDMSIETKRLRVGAVLLGRALVEYLEHPLPRMRLPSERAKVGTIRRTKHSGRRRVPALMDRCHPLPPHCGEVADKQLELLGNVTLGYSLTREYRLKASTTRYS